MRRTFIGGIEIPTEMVRKALPVSEGKLYNVSQEPVSSGGNERCDEVGERLTQLGDME